MFGFFILAMPPFTVFQSMFNSYCFDFFSILLNIHISLIASGALRSINCIQTKLEEFMNHQSEIS